MIYSLQGKLVSSTDCEVVMQVSSVALSLVMPTTMGMIAGQEYTLYMHMQWHQEQGPSLYGFRTVQERDLFVLIIGCTGIGPKIALHSIKDLGVAAFVHTIQHADYATLSKVPGIGMKKAEQLVLHLRDKINKYAVRAMHNSTDEHNNDTLKLVYDALLSLEYSPKEIAHVVPSLNPQHPFDQLIRQALQALAK